MRNALGARLAGGLAALTSDRGWLTTPATSTPLPSIGSLPVWPAGQHRVLRSLEAPRSQRRRAGGACHRYACHFKLI